MLRIRVCRFKIRLQVYGRARVREDGALEKAVIISDVTWGWKSRRVATKVVAPFKRTDLYIDTAACSAVLDRGQFRAEAGRRRCGRSQ